MVVKELSCLLVRTMTAVMGDRSSRRITVIILVTEQSKITYWASEPRNSHLNVDVLLFGVIKVTLAVCASFWYPGSLWNCRIPYQYPNTVIQLRHLVNGCRDARILEFWSKRYNSIGSFVKRTNGCASIISIQMLSVSLIS